MAYFNADGQRAELCLNATRCAVQLAAHLGWSGQELEIETDAGSIRGRALGEQAVALELTRPAVPRSRDLEHDRRTVAGWYVEVGVPHFVLTWPRSLDSAPLTTLGPALRHHETWGAAGANVNFVRFVDRHRLEIRTFERGVEGETLACGSGVMAAAATGIAIGQLQLPVRAQTLGGFELEVGPALSRDRGDAWSLTGDARLIAEGTLHSGALEVPEPPTWSD
jgi:diaminopimelate epimerase